MALLGDGGNDVSMIQAASVGIGIVGKEGKQASLAADFSITQVRPSTYSDGRSRFFSRFFAGRANRRNKAQY